MALQAVMVLSDLTHWILHEICSSDGPWADTYFCVLIELRATTNWLFLLVILPYKSMCAPTMEWLNIQCSSKNSYPDGMKLGNIILKSI